MGFIETLNKYGKKASLSHTTIYQQVIENKSHLEAMGLKVKIKNDLDLFDFEILYKGMLTQNFIENAYEMFLSEHYDLMNYMNYEEKRVMFNNDIRSLLSLKPHFFDEKSQTDIYIPYLEPFVNQRYIIDYQVLLLKQHQEYIRHFKIDKDTPSNLYGIDIYRTDFSSLIDIYEDERHLCYYYDELKTIYIFQKETGQILNHVIIQDQHSQADIDIKDVKQVACFIETYSYQECLDFMLEKKWISEKTYRKVSKKYH